MLTPLRNELEQLYAYFVLTLYLRKIILRVFVFIVLPLPYGGLHLHSFSVPY